MTEMTDNNQKDPIGDRLRKELKRVKNSEKQLKKTASKQLETASFSCLRCGKCCRRECGDNSVFVRPDEIRKIAEKTGLSFKEISVPLFPDIFDVNADGVVFLSKEKAVQVLEETADQIAPDGTIRAFGRLLRRKADGSCRFLGDDGKCSIYAQRPLLCRTYPFWINDGIVEECECDGLSDIGEEKGENSEETKTDVPGKNETECEFTENRSTENNFTKSKITENKNITRIDKRELANDLAKRYVFEMEDMVMTYDMIRENLENDGGSDEGFQAALKNLENGYFRFEIYDSDGVSDVVEKLP